MTLKFARTAWRTPSESKCKITTSPGSSIQTQNVHECTPLKRANTSPQKASFSAIRASSTAVVQRKILDIASVSGPPVASNDCHPRIQCDLCNYEMCYRCQTPWHPDMTCDDRQQAHCEAEDLMSRTTTRCPGSECNVSISKGPGCLHMTCSACGHEVCWECLAAWEDVERSRLNHNEGCIFRMAIVDQRLYGERLFSKLRGTRMYWRQKIKSSSASGAISRKVNLILREASFYLYAVSSLQSNFPMATPGLTSRPLPLCTHYPRQRHGLAHLHRAANLAATLTPPTYRSLLSLHLH
ncbi:hypothetical protein BDV96DRAFT_166102 [Lophiotrema nucula]|uniref:RBR-type E3 ubiquitin transferase n=1 Tax=Lophiotrema nucula TaxID=690887 RepID=A0A6A5YXW6_9PLEO|nr:hypothetical protein BDV96DRAFT_166102 [Lophiotrema nucula]